MIGTRILYAMARDGMLPARGAVVNAGGTPTVATLVTTAVAIGLIATGTFQKLVAVASFFLAANYFVCCLALFVLRRREPGTIRPFRALGLPLVRRHRRDWRGGVSCGRIGGRHVQRAARPYAARRRSDRARGFRAKENRGLAMEDVRLAIRALRASPVVSLIAVLSLALGIGANTAIFSLVNGLLLRQLPVVEPQRLATISSDKAIQLGFNAGIGWNYAMWEQLRQRAQVFDGALAWSTQRLNLAPSGEMQPVDGLVATGEFFTLLGVKAALGRTFTVADDVRGGGPDGPVVVISDGLWRRRFGGDAHIIGTKLPIEGVPLTIVGVTPPGFLGLEAGRSFDVALPLATEPLIRKRALIDQPNAFLLFVMLRLKPGQPIDAATAALRAMQPEMHGSMRVPRFVSEPFTLVRAVRGITGPVRQRYERPLLTIFVVVALVLLIACANIANLLLARATARRHELSVRVALGAPRWRLARQFLVESLVLAGAGAAAGLALAEWGSRALVAQLSTAVSPVALDLSTDWRVFGFTAAITFATAVLFGTAPAFRAAGVAPIDAMKQHGRGAESGAGRGLSGILVVAQVALSLVLVVVSGLLVQTFARLATMPLGFDGNRVLIVTVDTARTRIDPANRVPFYHRLVAAIAAVPGVEHAAASTSTPVSAGLPQGFTLPGATIPESERVALWTVVTGKWFATYGTELRDGRDIDERDTAAGQPVAIVNQAFARRFLPGRRAIGESVSSRTIIGVVADQVMQGGYKADGGSRTLRDGAPPVIYMPVGAIGRTRFSRSRHPQRPLGYRLARRRSTQDRRGAQRGGSESRIHVPSPRGGAERGAGTGTHGRVAVGVLRRARAAVGRTWALRCHLVCRQPPARGDRDSPGAGRAGRGRRPPRSFTRGSARRPRHRRRCRRQPVGVEVYRDASLRARRPRWCHAGRRRIHPRGGWRAGRLVAGPSCIADRSARNPADQLRITTRS